MRLLSLVRLALLHFQGLPIAALITLQTLREALAVFGYPAVTFFIMIESMGVPFPGETMLLFASFYSAIDSRLQIPIVIVCAALGAILGDNIGYSIGRKGGRPFVERFGRYFFVKPEHLDRAEQFFAKHGGKTVFFGRFTTLLRLWSAFLAGVNHMHWRTFLLYNAAGGILWAIIYGTLGYVAGRFFHDNFGQVEHIARLSSWVAAGIIVVVVGAIILFLWLRHRRNVHRIQQETPEQENTEKIEEGVGPTP
jgi:membrane protein DedA with SNARE-associated domain